MADKSYTGINNPYDDNLERAGDPSQGNVGGGLTTSTGDYGGIEDANAVGSSLEDVTSSAGETSSNVVPGATVGASLSDLWINTWIKSRSYQPKVSGFYIDGKSGYAEFANVYVVGTIIAASGTIGGWTINATTLTGGDTTLDSTGVITLGTGNNIVKLSSVDATYRLWIGNATAASAPFSVTKAGAVAATSGAIGGFTLGSDYIRDTADSFGFASTVTGGNDVRIWAGASFANRATAPFIVYEDGSVVATGLTVDHLDIPDTTTANSFHVDTTGLLWSGANVAGKATAPVRLNPTGEMTLGSPSGIHLQLSGPNLRIRTSDFSAGAVGWNIDTTNAEFANITARGEFHSQILSYGEIHTTAGSSLLAKSGGKLKSNVTTATSPTTFNVDIDDPDTGHVQVFSVSDILRIKDGSGGDNWMTVSSVSDQTTFYRYVCVKSNGSNSTFKAGAAVVDYGQSGQGLILSTVDGTNAPYISVQTHAGSPWSTVTEQLRLGNLNGYLGYVAATYGLGIGSSSGTDANITIEATNGIRIRNGTTNKVTFDNSGNATLLNLTVGGSLNISTSGNIKSGQTAYNTGTGWFMEYNSGTPRFSIGDTTTSNSLTWDGSTLRVNGTPLSQQDLFGDGSDGAITYSGDTTLTSDIFATSITVNTGVTVNTGGFRIFCNGTLTINGTGKIVRNGNAGSNGANATGRVGGVDYGAGGAGGAALADGSIKGALAGVAGKDGVEGVNCVGPVGHSNGQAGGSGNAGTAAAKSLATVDSLSGANGGAGGTAGSGTGGATGGGGSAGARTGTIYNLIHNAMSAYRLYDDNGTAFLTAAPSNGGAASGGSGGVQSTGSSPGSAAATGATGGGGGGGSNAGIVVIFARFIVNNGTISAIGGVGGNAGTTFSSAASAGDGTAGAGGSGGSGGGHGGDGGFIILVYSQLTNNGTISVVGGAGGTGEAAGTASSAGITGNPGTAGTNGSTGNSGSVISIVV